MSRRVPLALTVLAFAAQACTAIAFDPAPHPHPLTVAAHTPSPAPVRSATPAPVASPAAKADVLLRPGTPVRLLAGDLEVDAGYAVGTGSGRFIGHNGSSVLAMGDLDLDAAGRLVAHDGGAIVAQGGGNIIAQGAGNVVSNDGGSVVSNDGGSIVAQGGGNAVTRSYRLAADAAAAPGSEAKAAGMRVQVTGLGDDHALPLGVNADGKPVYAIYTNANGHFELYLPASTPGTLHLHVQAPGSDPRLRYDHLATTADATTLALDEDHALVSRYLLHAFEAKLQLLLETPDVDDPAFQAKLFDKTLATPALASLVHDTLHAFRDRVTAAHVPPARYGELARRGSAVLLAHVDLASIKVDLANTHWDGPADELAIDGMRQIFAAMRVNVGRVLATDPAFFDHQDYLVKANAALAAGTPPYAIKKASDVGDFVVGAYFATLDPHQMLGATPVFESVATDADRPMAYKNVDHLFAITSGVALALAGAFLSDDAARAAVYAVIDDVARTDAEASGAG